MKNPDAVALIACEQLSKLATYDFQIFVNAFKVTLSTLDVDIGRKGDQACLRYQDKLYTIGKACASTHFILNFKLAFDDDEKEKKEKVKEKVREEVKGIENEEAVEIAKVASAQEVGEERHLQEQEGEIEENAEEKDEVEELSNKRSKRARKQVERYQATTSRPIVNHDMLIAGQIKCIKQMPVADRQVVKESSQEVRCSEKMSANDIVETFKMCERAELSLKRRKYELALRMWKNFCTANNQTSSKLTRKQYFEVNAVNDISQAYQILYLGEKLETIQEFLGDESLLYTRDFLMLSLDHVSKSLNTFLSE
ncbi:hypothetical protein EDC96DRAFT_550193 [Choanephora cucurbitarum]|nr:hypothetical protein EDC96DRAFT_550193 [Choanephora cucurbitarum]